MLARLKALLLALFGKHSAYVDIYLTAAEAFNTSIDNYNANPTPLNKAIMILRKRDTIDAENDLQDINARIATIKSEIQKLENPAIVN